MGEPLSIDVEQVSRELKIRPEIYVRIVTSFAGTLQSKLKALGEALSTNNIEQMRIILHEIRGTAGNLRLRNISMAEGVLHVALKEGGRTDMLRRYYENLKKESDNLLQYTQQLPRPSSPPSNTTDPSK